MELPLTTTPRHACRSMAVYWLPIRLPVIANRPTAFGSFGPVPSSRTLAPFGLSFAWMVLPTIVPSRTVPLRQSSSTSQQSGTFRS